MVIVDMVVYLFVDTKFISYGVIFCILGLEGEGVARKTKYWLLSGSQLGKR